MADNNNNMSDSEEEDVPAVIGTRTSRRRTNWRYRYDALSQVNQAHLNDLLLFQESQCHAIELSMIFMTFICLKIHHINRTNIYNIDMELVDRLKRALILSLILLLYQLLSAQSTD
jgi:hypothetical protein